MEPWEEKYLDKVNVIRMNHGKKPFRTGGRKPFSRTAVVCRYCNIKGHFQKECRKRLKDGKPQVDAQGKAYLHDNKMNPIKDEEEDEEEEGISALSYYGISSIRRKHLN